jgi:hypothetical protein
MEVGNRWNLNGGSSGYAIDAPSAHSGSRYVNGLAVGAGVSTFVNYQQDGATDTRFSARQGDEIHFSGWVTRRYGSKQVWLIAKFYDGSDTLVGTITSPLWSGTADTYYYLEATGTAPANSSYFLFGMEIHGADAGGTGASFDDVSLETLYYGWPAELPNPDYGWNEGEVDGMIIRSENDAGVAKQRLRYTAFAVPISASLTLSPQQIDTFRDFVANDLKYVLPFVWTDMLNDTDSVKYRFTKKPTYTRTNFGQITVGMSLERLP